MVEGKVKNDILNNFLSLMDYKVWNWLNIWEGSEDEILSSLCKRLLYRKFYKRVKAELGFELVKKILTKLDETAKEKGIKTEYMILEDKPTSRAYKDDYILSKPKDKEKGGEEEASEQIFLFEEGNEEAKELSKTSDIINIIRKEKIAHSYLFVPEELEKDTWKIIEEEGL